MWTGGDTCHHVAAAGVRNCGERRAWDRHLHGAQGALGSDLDDFPANRPRPLCAVGGGVHLGERDFQPAGVHGRPLRRRELHLYGRRRQPWEDDNLTVHLLEVEISPLKHAIQRISDGRRLARAIHPVTPIRKEARAERNRDPRLIGQERQRVRERDAVHDNLRSLREEPAVRPGP